MTSPATIPPRPRLVASNPDFAASPPLGTACTSTPCDFTPSCFPTFGSAAVMFRLGSTTLPNSMSCGTTLWTRSTGIANPTPALAPVLVKMAVFTPVKHKVHMGKQLENKKSTHRRAGPTRLTTVRPSYPG